MKLIKQPLKRIIPDIENEWSSRLTNAILGAILFIVVGYYVPNIYYKYFDNREYFKINSVQTTEAAYAQCAISTVVVQRTSQIDANATRYVDIALQSENGESTIPVPELTRNILIERNDNKIIIDGLTIPCSLKNGEYRWVIKIHYMVHDNPRFEVAKSNPFIVSTELSDLK